MYKNKIVQISLFFCIYIFIYHTYIHTRYVEYENIMIFNVFFFFRKYIYTYIYKNFGRLQQKPIDHLFLYLIFSFYSFFSVLTVRHVSVSSHLISEHQVPDRTERKGSVATLIFLCSPRTQDVSS